MFFCLGVGGWLLLDTKKDFFQNQYHLHWAKSISNRVPCYYLSTLIATLFSHGLGAGCIWSWTGCLMCFWIWWVSELVPSQCPQRTDASTSAAEQLKSFYFSKLRRSSAKRDRFSWEISQWMTPRSTVSTENREFHLLGLSQSCRTSCGEIGGTRRICRISVISRHPGTLREVRQQHSYPQEKKKISLSIVLLYIKLFNMFVKWELLL